MLGKRPHRHIISDFGKIHNNHNLPRHIVVGFELVTSSSSSSSSSSSGESTHDHAKTKKKSFFTADPCRNNISPRSVLRPAHPDHNPDGHGPHRDFHAKKREEAYVDDSRVVLDSYNLRAGLLAEQIYNTTNVEEGFIDDDDYNGCGGDHGSISSPYHHHNHHGIKHNVGNMIVHTWPMMGIERVNVPDVLVNEDTSLRIPLANMKFGHISASTRDGDTSIHACPTTKCDDKPSDIDEITRVSMGAATRNFDGIHEDMRPAHTWPGTIFQPASPPNHRGFETSFSSRMMFLEHCFLCRSSLQGKDIFMYRGDKAFCSMECRHKQIVLDERE